MATSEIDSPVGIEIGKLREKIAICDEPPVLQAQNVFAQIEKIQDESTRHSSLKKVESIILSTDFSKGNPQVRLSRLRSVEDIYRLYCIALSKANVNLEERIFCRFTFWKRLSEERERAKHSVTDGEDDIKRPGLHVPTEFYLDWLDWTCPYHLQWAERCFNSSAVKTLPAEMQSRLRQKIEVLIGRRIRTDEEILRDWRRRQSEKR